MVRYALRWIAAAALCLAALSAHAQGAPPRVALVIGNGGYAQGALSGALNDAGLVAEVLRGAGFDVTEGADLRQGEMLSEFRSFAAKVEAGGPDTIAVFYFSGYGLALEKDNLLVGADAALEFDTDLALDTVRLADLLQPLSALPARAKIIILDAAHALPFPMKDVKIAPGLLSLGAPPNTLVAISAAPGALIADGAGAYGAYALSIAEMFRTAGLDVTEIFTRVRARTHQVTQGEQTPWFTSSVAPGLTLMPADPKPPPVLRGTRPMNEIGVEEAYGLAIEQDTLAGYAEFVRTFPSTPYTLRMLSLLHLRRETLTWQRALEVGSPEAYWTYLKRFPDGLYIADAGRRLARLSVSLSPPPVFEQVAFADVPAPSPGEVRHVTGLLAAPPARLIAPRPPLYGYLAPPSRDGTLRGPRTGKNVLPVVPSLPPITRITSPVAAPAAAAPPVHRLRPKRPAAARPPQATPAPATPSPFPPKSPPPAANAQRAQQPRSLAPPQLRSTQPARPTLRQPQCTVENGQTSCR